MRRPLFYDDDLEAKMGYDKIDTRLSIEGYTYFLAATGNDMLVTKFIYV